MQGLKAVGLSAKMGSINVFICLKPQYFNHFCFSGFGRALPFIMRK